MPTIVLAVIQWLHVFLAIWWFGGLIDDRVLFRRVLRVAGPEATSAVRSAEQRLGSRRYTALVSFGTIGLGIIRGALGGALGRLDEPYGWTYLAAMALGLAMLGWLWLPIPDGPYTPLGRKVYVACFPLIFTLMVLMRFGY